MNYFDLHCDTMTECCLQTQGLYRNCLHVDLLRSEKFPHYFQCFAAWIPDDLRGEQALARFQQIAGRLREEQERNKALLSLCEKPGSIRTIEANGTVGAILTVENGSALGGRLESIEALQKENVKMITLTWNGENELGRGVKAPGCHGLTAFGKRAVKALEQAGIVVDVSHASEQLFEDVMRIASKPVVASHSNAKAVCDHPRNLEDRQFLQIKASGGLVGLNFFQDFLREDGRASGMEDVLRHADHFLHLGGEDVLSIGADWDGATLPKDMDGLASIPSLQALFLEEYGETLTEKIFYGNAVSFFERNKLL